MEFTSSNNPGFRKTETLVPITRLLHSALVGALNESADRAMGVDLEGFFSSDSEAIAELMAGNDTFLKELCFIAMLASENAPENLSEAIAQLGVERMHNVVLSCVLIDRLRRNQEQKWCLHRALFLADVCWAVSRMHDVDQAEQIYIMRLLQGLGYLAPDWDRRVFGGEQLRRFMLMSELAVHDMPPADAQVTPLSSMEASHEWLAKKDMDELLDSLALTQ